MRIRNGVVKNFDSGSYRATVQLEGSDRVYLENVVVARNIAAVEVTAGREAAIVFFDDYNSQEAVIIGVFER